jgi:hypothetical protein
MRSCSGAVCIEAISKRLRGSHCWRAALARPTQHQTLLKERLWYRGAFLSSALWAEAAGCRRDERFICAGRDNFTAAKLI